VAEALRRPLQLDRGHLRAGVPFPSLQPKSEAATQVIPRKSGEVIVGGTREDDDWHASPRPETARAIKERALKLCPELLSPDKRSHGTINDLDIITDGWCADVALTQAVATMTPSTAASGPHVAAASGASGTSSKTVRRAHHSSTPTVTAAVVRARMPRRRVD
jgi:glycine/D-amino acid oxidase-like deaminating enzyme